MKISPSVRFLLSFTINSHNSFLPSPEDGTHFIITEENDLIHTEKQKAGTRSKPNTFSAINKNSHEY